MSGPLELRILRISILLGLAITEKIILTRFDVDCKRPPPSFESASISNSSSSSKSPASRSSSSSNFDSSSFPIRVCKKKLTIKSCCCWKTDRKNYFSSTSNEN